MPTEVTVAIIGVVSTIIVSSGTLIGVIITNKRTHRDIIASLDKQQAVFEATVTEKINELSKKVDRHNNIITRTYDLEAENKVQNEKIATLSHQMAELSRRA